MTTREEKKEQDRGIIMRWLWRISLITVEQLARVSEISPNRVHRLLKELQADGMVVQRSLAGARRRDARYWLSFAGITALRDDPNAGALPWQSTETGIATRVPRMPWVDRLINLLIDLWAHEGIRPDRPVRMTPDIKGEQIVIGPGLKLGRMVCFDNEPIDAVAIYSNMVWVALKVVGQELSAYRLQEQVAAVDECMDRLMRYAGLPTMPTMPTVPTGWVLLCHDRAAAAHAAQVWRGDNVLVLDVHGRVERAMKPSDFSIPYPPLDPGSPPGNPELHGRRRGREPAQNAPENEFAYQMFRFLAQWGFATRAQLRRKFGERYVKAVKELQQKRLVGVSGDVVRLREPAVQVLADCDGADAATVHGRLSRFVDLRRGLLRNPVHDTAAINVFLKAEALGLAPAEGSRYTVYLPDGTQIVPDLVFCLDREEGRTLLVFLEVEFSSTHPQEVRRKALLYMAAEQFGVEVASAWLVETEDVRRRYAEALGDLVAITATIDQFLTGPSWGPDSAWRWRNWVEDISGLAAMMDVDVDAILRGD